MGVGVDGRAFGVQVGTGDGRAVGVGEGVAVGGGFATTAVAVGMGVRAGAGWGADGGLFATAELGLSIRSEAAGALF
ncbi:MAG: hypothetical protein FI707_06705 [SAR202 cluster bacterium]|jgi:hypothetical protein|nr:hypothetical protein [SAR202 cluster bacterium]